MATNPKRMGWDYSEKPAVWGPLLEHDTLDIKEDEREELGRGVMVLGLSGSEPPLVQHSPSFPIANAALSNFVLESSLGNIEGVGQKYVSA